MWDVWYIRERASPAAHSWRTPPVDPTRASVENKNLLKRDVGNTKRTSHLSTSLSLYATGTVRSCSYCS
jgi:hypothetical protein